MIEGEVVMVAYRCVKTVWVVDCPNGTQVTRATKLDALFAMANEIEALIREEMPDQFEQQEGAVH